MTLHEQITTDLKRLVLAANADIITPASLAMALQQEYDRELEPHIQYTSMEHLKSMARGVLRKRYDVKNDEDDAHQGELFSGHLQRRYPLPRQDGQEPAYKMLESLTPDEVAWNVNTLFKNAKSYRLHAKALAAWAKTHCRGAA